MLRSMDAEGNSWRYMLEIQKNHSQMISGFIENSESIAGSMKDNFQLHLTVGMPQAIS